MDARFYERALEGALPPERIDLVDAHFEWPDGVGAWRVARRRGIPFVCTLRGKLVSQIGEPSKRRQIVKMLQGATKLIAVSESLADAARSVAGEDLAIRVIPNGVDTSIFHPLVGEDRPRAELGWLDAVKYVVSVGHLQELKGFHRLVEVWPEVRRRAGDVRLVLIGGEAGEPRYAGRLRGLISSLGLGGVVYLTGPLPPTDVARRLAAADLFALASRSEGWCNAMAEALASGCPVVATDVGGNREVMNDWGLGRLVPFDNPTALAERIADALEETWDHQKIAEFGGRRSWRQVAEDCVDVFEEALGRKLRVADPQSSRIADPSH